MTKKEKKEARRLKRQKSKAEAQKRVESAKVVLKEFLNLGGEYSPLELCVLAAQKFGVHCRGDIHPNQQIRYFANKARVALSGKEPKLKCKTKKDFYNSRAWKILRYQALEKHGNNCQCCGVKAGDGVVLHVDHIKPKSTHPELALDLDNLQILCADCNLGKINQFDTDWRP